MTTKMLIDARHPEETRVAVVTNNRVEEFDFEAAARKQIKGNIYLAKITRVEPSLQAAFVDYGGNRHGFLAFSEIHPDYYQIPKEDREQLLLEEQSLAEEHQALSDREDEEEEASNARADGDGDGDDDGNGGDHPEEPEEHGGAADDIAPEVSPDDLRRRRMALRRRYKIQEVIRRRQVMLVQVVKEERGNKGAALTTYISLAGRYSVLMPNTAHGGGISRKITNVADRRRLKEVMDEIALPSAMGAIIRTAGVERTKAEIRRDFNYLSRLWDEIREKTLASTAPALIYEDSALIKRAIRDIYSRDVKEVIVDGKDGHQEARSFMRLLMPSHVRRVQLYEEPLPLFQKAGIETQLTALIDPVVTLKSGGYLVINSTEALVAVDVNSGRANREHSIEETALKTNIEAAEEVARQLRLRDLAGLVVVDFIDMESHANNRRVERALKDALKHDRARVQVGRISSFGLLEMSRQRMRTGVLEATTKSCPTCDGSGVVRTESSAALAALRHLEEESAKGRNNHFRLRTDQSSAIYILNNKRAELVDLEERYGVTLEIAPDHNMAGGLVEIDASGPKATGNGTRPVKSEASPTPAEEEKKEAKQESREEEDTPETEEEERETNRRPRRRGGRGRNGRSSEPRDSERDSDQKESSGDEEQAADQHSEDDEQPRESSRRRRRPRRRSGRDQDGRKTEQGEQSDDSAGEDDASEEPKAAARTSDSDSSVSETSTTTESDKASDDSSESVADKDTDAPKPAATRRRSPRRRKTETVEAGEEEAEAKAEAGEDADEEGKAKSAPRRRRAPAKRSTAETKAEEQSDKTEEAPKQAAEDKAPKAEPKAEKDSEKKADVAEEAKPASSEETAQPKEAANTQEAEGEENTTPRRGWWQRTFGA